MPTRRPTISESARLVSSVIRAAAASVNFITCGRGRGFALAGVVDDGVISVIYSILAGHQSRHLYVSSLSPNLLTLHHMLRTRRASSVMRSGVHAGSHTMLTLTWPT